MHRAPQMFTVKETGLLIVSHKYRFIFLRTRKTAGSSLDIALSADLGPTDVVTPGLPREEAWRRQAGFVTAQNYHKRVNELRPVDLGHALVVAAKRCIGASNRTLWPMAYRNHTPAVRVRELVGNDVWNSYFKFAVERNPWDFCVSLYAWKRRHKRGMSFGEFVAQGHPQRFAGSSVYCIDGAPAVDMLVRFENLAEDLAAVSARIGLPDNLHERMCAVNAKHGLRRDTCYRDMYDAATKQYIEDAFGGVIDHLRYSF